MAFEPKSEKEARVPGRGENRSEAMKHFLIKEEEIETFSFLLIMSSAEQSQGDSPTIRELSYLLIVCCIRSLRSISLWELRKRIRYVVVFPPLNSGHTFLKIPTDPT